MTQMTKHIWLYLSTALLTLLAGCGSPHPQEEDSTGSAQLFGTMEQALSSADVTSVLVTVSAADMQQPRTAALVKTNNQWSGTIGKLPAGAGRTFSAEAFDTSGTKLYAGEATNVTILARQTTAVSITLQEVNPPAPFENAAPVITSLSAAPGTVEIGGTVVLTAAASDANAGDSLTYAWSAPSGSFAQPSSLSTTWTAPASAAVVPLTLTVTDSKGVPARVTFHVTVNSGKGDAIVNATLNTWPQVSNISASATALEVNESTTVSATASDNDSDTLAYSWTASCDGTWSNATSPTAQFTATALPTSNVCNNCNLIVTVTDSRNGQPIGGQTTGTLSICVGPRQTALFPPDITETFQSAVSAAANGTVTFRVRAADPQGSAMSFSWAANTGTAGPSTSSADTSEVVWTAPACVLAATTPTLTATVSNALGASASHSFTVTGLPACAPQAASVLIGGYQHSVRVKQDGTVWAWGENNQGQLGDGTITRRLLPVQVPDLHGVTALAAGQTHTVALRQDGTVWAWGFNGSGQLGDGTTARRLLPVQVPDLHGVTALAAGQSYTVALRQDGTVWAWGDNANGHLGDGTTTRRLLPVRVPSLNGVTALAAGNFHTVALRQDGTVWTWGHNIHGQLGNGTTTGSTTPVQVPDLHGVTAVAAGNGHTVALRQDGTVWAWGFNSGGQLGNGTATGSASPVQVPDFHGVTALSARYLHTVALRQDGTVWAWGTNSNGQLGDGTTTLRRSPVQVPDLNGVTALAAGDVHTLVLRQDGAVWAWGNNTFGQLGNGTVTSRPSPVQVLGF
jgi:alpha-tubulin suppressor-like RCC1 family protein